MMKNLYVLAWLLLTAAVLIAALTGILNPAALMVSSLVALGLFYGLALWSVIANTQKIKIE